MTPEFEAAKQRIETITNKWNVLMDMSWLLIRHTYNESFNEDSHFIVATTDADWEYRMATIDWHLPRVTALPDERLEDVVGHEFVHVLNASAESAVPTKDAKLCEYATENVARAILSVYRGSNA